MLDVSTTTPYRRSFASDEMGQKLFEKHYPLYSRVLQTTGLMPFDSSLLTITKRVIYIALLVYCFYVQGTNLYFVEKTITNIVWMLSFTCPIVLFSLRYCSFLLYRKLTGTLFDNIGTDIESLKDPVEIEIFAKQTTRAQLIIKGYLAAATFLTIYTAVVLLLPTLLHHRKQLQCLTLYGYFYKEQSLQVNVICITVAAVTIIGVYAIVGTEGTLAVYSSYFSGLLEIASYRIALAIQTSEHEKPDVLIKVQPSLDLQRRSIYSMLALQDQQTIAYLLAIGAVILSFAVTLFRDLLFAGGSLALQLSVMFFNNYCGQILKDAGEAFYSTIIQSAWYNVPLKSKKILLFIMARSIKDVECNLAGLYKLSFDGFALMMNSSFSYFTLLYSTQ